MTAIKDKMRENWLRWLRNVNRRPTNGPIRKCDCETEAHRKRGRGKPTNTLKKTLRIDMEYLELMEDLT